MIIATSAMMIQQAFSYVCQIVMPILADRLAEEFGISRGWLGFYLALQNVVAIIAAIGCGGFILRYGPVRVSQVTLFLMGGSLVIIASGQLWLYPLGAMLMGAASVSTPASSHILARVCPPRLAPLVFSIKQTGVPVGALIGGLLLPFLLGVVVYSDVIGETIRVSHFGAALITALIVFAVAITLQPIRDHFDEDRDPATKISFGDLRATMKAVLGNPPLRDLAFAAFAFGGLQALFSGFFVLFLIDGLGYSEIEAGTAFAISSFTAIWARIMWGWLAGGYVSPRYLLAAIGLIAGIAAIIVARFDVSWGLFEITLVAIVFNISAISWHGLLLAETARLAPKENVGGVTGGVLAFTSIAMMIYPAVYGAIFASTGSYSIGFLLAAVPSFLAFLIFILPPIEGAWTSFIARNFVLASHQVVLLQAACVLGLGIGLGVAWGQFG
ncbi:MAG: MFS transporter [Alphaproteobacteria bacterium]